MKDLTIKFYEQPENGEKIGATIYDTESFEDKLPFSNGENTIDFTYKAQETVLCNGVMAFNSDFSMVDNYNSGYSGTNPGVKKTSGDEGLVYDADSDGAYIVMGGLFDNYNEYSSRNMVVINRNGDLIANFGTLWGSSAINCVRYDTGSAILVGTSTNLFDGVTVRGFTRLTSGYVLDTTFNNNVISTGGVNATTVVTAIEKCPTTGKIYVGLTNSLATGGCQLKRFNTDGTLDGSFTCNVDTPTYLSLSYIRTIAIDPDNAFVLIGGNFQNVNSTARKLVAKVSTTDGSLSPFISLTGGTECKAITLHSSGDTAFIAVNSNYVSRDTASPTIYDIKGKGIIQAATNNGTIALNFLNSIGKGIRCYSGSVSNAIYSIAVVQQYGTYPFITKIAIGGDFKTFGEFRAENFASFELDTNYNAIYGTEYTGVPNIDTIKFPTNFVSRIYKVLASKVSQGGGLTTLPNNFYALGIYDRIRGMQVTRQFTPSGSAPYGSFTIMKDIEIGEYKNNVNSINFQFIQANEAEGDIGVVLLNTYNPTSNSFDFIGELFEFRYAPTAGQIQIGAFSGITIANFKAELEARLTPYFEDLYEQTNGVNGIVYGEGWRDFTWSVETVSNGLTLTINNKIWDNGFTTTSTYPGGSPFIICNVGEAIQTNSALSMTYWKTYNKLQREYQGVYPDYIDYRNAINVTPGTPSDLEYPLAYDNIFGGGDIDGSEIHLELYTDTPTGRTTTFTNLVQLLGEIELFSVEQLVDDSEQFLVRSPAFVKTTGATTYSIFNIYSYIGNIYDLVDVNYSVTKQKIVSTQNTLFIDIANITKENLEADITGFISEVPVMALGENESRWVKVGIDNYSGNTLTSQEFKYYHIMDGYVAPIEINESNTIPKILTPHTNLIAKGSAPRLYYLNKGVVFISASIFLGYDITTGDPEYLYIPIDANVFIAQNNEYYNSIYVPEYLGTNDNITFSILYDDDTEEVITYNTYEECKYEVYDLIFKNKWGVLETLSMSKKSTKTLNIDGTDYLRSIVDINGDYDINRHTNKQYNVGGYEEWTLNTDFIPQYMNESIKQAMEFTYDAEQVSNEETIDPDE